MDTDYWLGRWTRNEIGFHQREENPHLLRFWHQLGLQDSDKVFVPLAGKSRDMLWLRSQGHAVMGVEISPVAVTAFFHEAGLPVTNTQQGVFERQETSGLVLLGGDFFALSARDLAGVSAVYDRGALVSLAAAQREKYVAQMEQLLPTNTKTLLVGVEYDQSLVDGPPFSVTEAEVHRLYGATHEIRLLHEEDVLSGSTKFREGGLSWLLERVYLLTFTG